MGTLEEAYRNRLTGIFAEDEKVIRTKDEEYEGSWHRAGGRGAYENLRRKWDRITQQTRKDDFDIFVSIRKDVRPEGILDDIRDLRRYLALVEAYMTVVDHTGMDHPFGYEPDE